MKFTIALIIIFILPFSAAGECARRLLIESVPNCRTVAEAVNQLKPEPSETPEKFSKRKEEFKKESKSNYTACIEKKGNLETKKKEYEAEFQRCLDASKKERKQSEIETRNVEGQGAGGSMKQNESGVEHDVESNNETDGEGRTCCASGR